MPTDLSQFGVKANFEPSPHYRFGKPLRKRRLVTLSGLSMGGQYMCRAIVDAAEDLELLNAGIKNTLDIVENQMSIFKPNSALMRFNQLPMGQWFDLPLEMAENIAIALDIGLQTGGALDITIGPVVEAWGFGAAETKQIAPKNEKLQRLRAAVGHEYLEFDAQKAKLLKRADCKISLNAIAKGYGADCAANYLKAHNIDDFMVEVAGEIVTAGEKPDGTKWRLAIETPMAQTGKKAQMAKNQQLLDLSDMAIATSGDYRKYFELDGVRYSHVIDPQTLRPIRHKLASTTVIAPSSAQADALATALLVMGEDKAWEFVVQHKLAAYLIVKTQNGFESLASDEMQPYYAV